MFGKFTFNLFDCMKAINSKTIKLLLGSKFSLQSITFLTKLPDSFLDQSQSLETSNNRGFPWASDTADIKALRLS